MAASTQSSQESLNSFLSRTSGRFGSVQKGGAGSHTHTSSNNDVDNSSRRVWHLVVGNQVRMGISKEHHNQLNYSFF